MADETQQNLRMGLRFRQAARDIRDTLHELPVYGWLSKVAHHRRTISIATIPLALMLYNIFSYVGMTQAQRDYVASAVISAGSVIYDTGKGLACRADPHCSAPKND